MSQTIGMHSFAPPARRSLAIPRRQAQPWQPMPPGRRAVRSAAILPWIADSAALLAILVLLPLAIATAAPWFGLFQ